MEALFLKLLNMSLTASYVIVAVLLIRLLLRKAPRKYSYALWSVVAFRLACPVSFESVFSLFNLSFATPDKGVEVLLEDVPWNTVTVNPVSPTVQTGIPAADQVITQSIPAPEVGASVNPVQIILFVGMILWCIGIAVLVTYSLVSYWRLRRKLDTAILMEENVYQSDVVRSPFILGFIRPKIYIPFGLQGNSLRYALAHERTHLKRLDHLIKPFAFLLLVVHWFNPLVWLAFHLMGKDMEMSCDEAVLSKEENIRKEYSTTLLSFATNKRFPSPSPLAFGETGVKGRIKNTLKWKKPRLWITVTAAVLCLLVVVACAANPKSEDDEIPQETVEMVFGPGTYVTYDCVFQNLYKSSFHPDGDNGLLYTKEERAFVIQPRDGGEGTKISDVTWEWQSYDQAKTVLEPLIDNTLGLDLSGYEEIFYQPLNEEAFLLKVDGAIWLAEVSGDMIWTIYSLVPQGYMGTALWQFKPQFSSTSPRFEFNTAGFGDMKLSVNLNDGRVELTEDGFAWDPMDENGQVLMEDRITFSLTYPDGRNAYWGNLYLSGARLEDGTGYCFTAELTGTGLYLVDSWNMDGAVILPEYTVTTPSDEEANGNNGSLTVVELAPGVTAVSENTITFPETGRVEYTFSYSRAGLDVEIGLIGEDGTEIRRHLTGGVSVDDLTDIPPGTYHFFLRNCRENLEYVNTTTVSMNVEVGVVQYQVIDGTLTPKTEGEKLTEERVAIIAALLEEICTSPAMYSAPSAYIEAHPEAYQELLNYGNLTLTYIARQFLAGGQTDLRGHIMRALLDDLTGLELRLYAETGQEYFDEWLIAAHGMADGMGMDQLMEEYPELHLVLSLSEEVGARRTEEQKVLEEEAFERNLLTMAENGQMMLNFLGTLFTLPSSRWEALEYAEMEALAVEREKDETFHEREQVVMDLLDGFISESESDYWANLVSDLHGDAIDTYAVTDNDRSGGSQVVQQRLYTMTPRDLTAEPAAAGDSSLWNVTVKTVFLAETGELEGQPQTITLTGTAQVNDDGTVSRLNLSRDSQVALKELQESFLGYTYAG